MKEIIKICENVAKKECAKHDSKHQWNHVEEVMDVALKLADFYPEVDLEILKLAVIFHDVIYNQYETHVDDSVKFARGFLKQQSYPKERINKIVEVILAHSGPHRRRDGDTNLIEGKIIYDADKFKIAKSSEGYKKYYPRFYLEETRKMVDTCLNKSPTA